jgi:hypothetical protein
MHKLLATTAIAALVLLLGAGTAQAETQWQKDHPGRTQVNNRLKNQNKRIDNEEKEGKITAAQAHQDHKEDHQIRHEERDMASQNHGHITKQEQKTLNQQENGVSKQIGH